MFADSITEYISEVKVYIGNYNNAEKPALGHDLIHHDAKEATCTGIGWNEYDTCSRCDYSTYAEISALGHNYVETVVNPAPVWEQWADGYICAAWKTGNRRTECTRCHDVLSDEIIKVPVTIITPLIEGEIDDIHNITIPISFFDGAQDGATLADEAYNYPYDMNWVVCAISDTEYEDDRSDRKDVNNYVLSWADESKLISSISVGDKLTVRISPRDDDDFDKPSEIYDESEIVITVVAD